MNKLNLIRLGALCQIRYDMDDDFKMIELPSDNKQTIYKVPIPNKIIYAETAHNEFTNIQIDEIKLEDLAFHNNFEYVRVGYGRKSNTLIVQEVDKWTTN